MSELRFDDKVAVVTGAGGGLGRSHALLLASRGAKVVVNDLGGTFKGDGASQKAADQVVSEIREAGGTAVANYDSVENGDKIIQTAIDEFGRVDIVVNNAGILRDVSFHKMTEDDWNKVYQVHVYGAFKVTHAAWPHMREQGYGRVIMTASAAGIYGNFGQANYAMAKLGLAGFANTLAIEGLRKNIHVNTIAPIAGSRMTETVLPPNLIEALRPEFVSPLVAWLCHQDCEENGGLFEVGGGFFSKLRWERSAGKTFRLGRDISPELVQNSWKQVASFESATHPEHIAGSMQPIMENVDAGPSKGGNELIDVDAALGYQFEPIHSSYDAKDLALYALAVGAAQDPLDDNELSYVYEMHSGGMKALPTFAVIPALDSMMEFFKSGKQAPGLNYGFERILHGEQYTEVLRPLPTSAKLEHRCKIKDIFDKGKHALVVTEINSYDQDGNQLIRNELTSVVRGAGGWGGDRGPSEPVNVAPDRKPDVVVEEQVPANQALLYRLTGDINPLHADPGFAKTFGFDKPILHGLCTFG
ncbi:MAG: SDR family NAD(P)-dependent oxidoreductase, partial [Deltaproteobacteria bacterium]|nr:SDR family NAD(P)-dependent oxidoreductase [Deltaproteobacteria bacterium]